VLLLEDLRYSRIRGNFIFQADLSFKNHIADKINKAHCMLGIIKRNFLPLLCKILVSISFGVC